MLNSVAQQLQHVAAPLETEQPEVSTHGGDQMDRKAVSEEIKKKTIDYLEYIGIY